MAGYILQTWLTCALGCSKQRLWILVACYMLSICDACCCAAWRMTALGFADSGAGQYRAQYIQDSPGSLTQHNLH